MRLGVIIIDGMIRFYQRVLSPDRGWIRIFIVNKNVHFCTMHPSCSEYARLAVRKYGALAGIYKGFLRILRCNPYQKELIDFP